MDASPAPVVIGPDSVFYLVDDHHTLCALDYSGYSSTTVTVEVIADRRNTTSMADFFADLEVKIRRCFISIGLINLKIRL